MHKDNLTAVELSLGTKEEQFLARSFSLSLSWNRVVSRGEFSVNSYFGGVVRIPISSSVGTLLLD